MDAVKNSGDSVAVIAAGGSGELLEGIRQGYITASVSMDPEATGKAVKEAAVALLENRPCPQTVLLSPAVVTKENMENPWGA